MTFKVQECLLGITNEKFDKCGGIHNHFMLHENKTNMDKNNRGGKMYMCTNYTLPFFRIV